MSIEIQSTTDNEETITNVLADKKEPVDPVIEPKNPIETPSDSEDLEPEEIIEDDINPDDDNTEIKKPKKNGFQKRINKLNTRLSNKDEEIDYWKQQAMKLNKPNQDPSKEPVNEPIENEKPKLDDYEEHEDYIEALTDWKMDEKLKTRDAKNNQDKMKTDQASQVKSFQDRNREFSETKTDYEETLNDVDHIKMSLTVQEVIIDSENGPELMYELAKDSEQFEKICKMSPLRAAKALGSFESRMPKKEATTITTKTSKAPKPISTVNGKSTKSGEQSIYDPDISQADYERLRNKQEGRR